MQVVYEDNHLIVVSKRCGEIVQGDKTGDPSLKEMLERYLIDKYNKPGRAFVGVVHRLDRPVAGLVIFAKTSKALQRMNEQFRKGEVHKRYLALLSNTPQPPAGQITSWLRKEPKNNKSYLCSANDKDAKEAKLLYTTLGTSQHYTLVSVQLLTGRHHQIRAQLSAIGCPIKGDLKYGAKRSNPDGGISLLSYEVSFRHPVSKELIELKAPLPEDPLWQCFASLLA